MLTGMLMQIVFYISEPESKLIYPIFSLSYSGYKFVYISMSSLLSNVMSTLSLIVGLAGFEYSLMFYNEQKDLA